MNRIRKAIKFIDQFGFKALPNRIAAEFLLRIGIKPKKKQSESMPDAPVPAVVKTDGLFRQHFFNLVPLRFFSTPGQPKRRLNLVTDSINSGSLFGGVGTSLILSSLLARRWDVDLRIVTRTQNADKRNYEQVLGPNKIPIPNTVEFAFADLKDPNFELPVSDGDVFLTTSWWSTSCVKQNVHPAKILYLLQEDERAFYAYGDDHLFCSEVIQDAQIKLIVNSKMLFDALAATGVDHIRETGLWFEPAWPLDTFFFDSRLSKPKKNFFFYARPNNIRNLFYRGIEAVEGAVIKGILNPTEWDFYFAGKDIPDLRINGIAPYRFENLAWADYAALVRKMDLGLCLMYSPHPSYPPLDLAASGAVAVTNHFGVKQNLDMYSKNILCRDPSVDGLIQGLADGAELAANQARRMENYRGSAILRDWNISFEEILRRLERWPESVYP